MRRRSKVIAGVLVVAAALGLAGGIVVWGGKGAEAKPIMSDRSPSGRYRAEVYVWPKGAKATTSWDRYVRLVMVDEASGEVVWEMEPTVLRAKGRPAERAHGILVDEMIVTDGGRVIVTDPMRGHFVVGGWGKQGVEHHLPVFGRSAAPFGGNPIKSPIDRVSEGPRLKYLRVSAVLDKTGTEHVVFRATSGRRAVFRANGGDWLEMEGFDAAADVSEVDPIFTEVSRVMAAIVADETGWSLKVLGEAAKRFAEGKGLTTEPPAETVQAMHIAGHLKRDEMIEFVRSIETSLLGADRSTVQWARWFALVRTTLRRMGQPLTEWGGYDVRIAERGPAAGSVERDRQMRAGVSSQEKIARAEKVREGMTAAEVAELLGGAEYRIINRSEWDIDAAEPFTIMVRIEKDRVVEVSRMVPARWQVGSERELP
jgi:hypothetical protein